MLKFTSPIDNCEFDYQIVNGNLSYKIEGTDWQDFILEEVKWGCKVFQKNWDWFVNYNDQTTLFRDGMILLDADSLITA